MWGADHHGHVARLKGALDALGLNGSERLDIVLMQLVKLLRDGEVVRMSKRTGKAISLSDLLDEVSVDAARYFFNSRASTSPWISTWIWPSGRTAKIPCTMSSTPTPASVPFENLAARDQSPLCHQRGTGPPHHP